MKGFIPRTLEIYKPHKRTVLMLLGLIFLSNMVAMAVPYLWGRMVDRMVPLYKQYSSDGGSIEFWVSRPMFFAYALLACTLLAQAINFYKERSELKKFDFAIPQYASLKTMEKMHSFSLGQHKNEHSGVKQDTIEKGEHSLVTLANMVIYQIGPIVFRIGLTVFVLLWLNRLLGLIVLASIVLFWFVTRNINRVIADDLRKLQNMSSEDGKLRSEIFRNIDVTQINVQEKRIIQEYDKHRDEMSDFGVKLWMGELKLSFWRDLISPLTTFALIATSVYCVARGVYTVGSVVAAYAWASGAIGRLGEFSPIQRQMNKLRAAIEKYFVMMDLEPEVKVIENPVKLEKVQGRIRFEDVWFSYRMRDYLDEGKVIAGQGKSSEPILRALNFEIYPGETVALVGPNGAGKSTLLDLLERGYDPDQGRVLLDGEDLRLLDLRQIREAIGFVEQDVVLYNNTLRYNMLFGLNGRSRKVSEEDLLRLAEVSRITSFSPKLEKGFNTLIGERGVKLSGGQRKMVGIARALAKNPSILVFDEATAGLDTKNEFLLNQALEEAGTDRTMIVISHRLSTVQKMDRILVLDETGAIVGNGKHEKLYDSCPSYTELLRHQTF